MYLINVAAEKGSGLSSVKIEIQERRNMNLYYFDKTINTLAAKRNLTSSERLRLCQMLQDAESAGYIITFDKKINHYTITGGDKSE